MSRRIFGTGIVSAVLVGACGAAMALAACSNGTSNAVTDAGTETSTGPCTASSALQISFAPMYSAFVTDSTTHTFQVPATVTGGTGTAKWTASDPNAVTFSPGFDPGSTNIRVKALTSVVTITAQVGSLCTSTQLNVTPAVEADWQAGYARYNNGVPMYPGCVGAKVAPLLVDSGFVMPPPPDSGCPDAGPACTGCHGDNPTGGFFQGVQHTPAQTGGFSDPQLTDIFVRALDPNYDTSYLPYEYWHAFHTWSDIDTPQAQKAMVVYLRSLTPTGDPDAGLTE